MAEIGLVTLARIARAVGRAALPAYRSPLSTRQLTQPQLLAVLCLMRYADRTFRAAAVRLAEHRELRAALGLAVAPDDTTLYRLLRRLTAEVLEHTLRAVVQRLIPQMDGPATVAVDATGPTPGAISTFFVNWSPEDVNRATLRLKRAAVGTTSCDHARAGLCGCYSSQSQHQKP